MYDTPYENSAGYMPSEMLFGFGDAVTSGGVKPPQYYGAHQYGSIGSTITDWQANTQKMITTIMLGGAALVVIGILGIGALIVLSKR